MNKVAKIVITVFFLILIIMFGTLVLKKMQGDIGQQQSLLTILFYNLTSIFKKG